MRRSTCNRLPAVRRTITPQPRIPGFIATAYVKPRAALEGQAALRQLSEDMRQAGQREGGVTRDDLQLLGWTGAQLDAHGTKARLRAQSLAEMTA